MAQGPESKGQKKRQRNIVTLVLLIVALAILVFALSRLIPILTDYRQANTTYDELADTVVDDTAGVNGQVDDTKPWNEYDWQSISIDFNALKQINPDVIGWIRFDNTDAVNVNYPILHGETNDDYIHTDLYGTYHYAGSIFLESGNSPALTDVYNIIYGHNMRNGSMFGTLRRYRDREGFYEENPYFTIYTPRGAFRYEIFGYANVSQSSEIYRIGFEMDDEYQELIDLMRSLSDRDTGVVPKVTQKTVTLSTCTSAGETYRFVVFGVCVEQLWY